ncbi:MAG: sugar porter family MFS transporter [Saprospiraceae bacterium]|nr:sugar porter family MFS transporter [Saprospiraceae bacterium]
MSPKYILYYCAVVAALSGFLFGFDTVVISGAEQTLQKLWDLDSFMHGLTISMALWGTLLGAFIGRFPTELWGRKNALILVGFLYLISALGTALATDVYTFIIFRFMGGLGIGISTIAAPLYISEISPPEKRGKLTGMFQFNIVFGILIAYISNALLSHLGPDAWRYMLGVLAIPSAIYIFLCMNLPESPRWLILRRKDNKKAREIFSNMNPGIDQKEIADLVESISASTGNAEYKKPFFTKTLLKPILLAFFIAFFNQLSGINAILYYAPRIFELTGLGQEASLLQSVGIGLINLIFTLVGLRLIDKAGRKSLLYWGAFGYILSLGLCSFAFATEFYDLVTYGIFAFIAAHAIGQGAVIWVFISEIFPNQHRDAGQTLGSFTHWLFAALLTLIFPKLVNILNPAIIFGIFCFLMLLQLFWIKMWVPETKGISLENMEKKLGM